MMIIVGVALVVLVVIPAILIRYSQSSSEAKRLKSGDNAPDFTLPDQNGRSVRLSDYRGKKNVILAFYIKAGTPG